MFRLFSLTLASAVTAACSPPEPAPPAAPAEPAAMVCDAGKAQQHVGHPVSQQMGEAILKDTGARTLRWGGPDTAWTMDYREDRVGVRYNANRIITEIACG